MPTAFPPPCISSSGLASHTVRQPTAAIIDRPPANVYKGNHEFLGKPWKPRGKAKLTKADLGLPTDFNTTTTHIHTQSSDINPERTLWSTDSESEEEEEEEENEDDDDEYWDGD